MKVRLLSLNVDKNMPFSRFQARVVSSIKAYSEETPSFEKYENMRDMFNALQEAFEDTELIVTAIDTKHYLKYKKVFMDALETQVKPNSAVLNMLESHGEIDDETRKGFSLFPEVATVFLSNDGLYSGFGIENGTQYVICIPIDNDRINLILRNGVIPFLSKYIDGASNEDFVSETKFFDNEKVSIAVKRLLDSQSVVAVNGTQNAEIIKSCGDNTPQFDDVFVFTPHVEDKGEVNVTEYAAQLAKVSLDLSAANIGASISDIYSAGDVHYICIAVANDESAVVRKLYMAEGETEEEFVESAAVELIELIGEKAMGMQSVGIEISDGNNAISEEEKKPAGKKPMTVLAVVLAAIILLCAILGIVYKIQGENGTVAKVLKGVFGNSSVTETATEPPSTTEAPTETQTQAPVATVKLSDYMIADLIAIEKNKNESSATETTSQPAESSTEPTTDKDEGAPSVIKVNGEKIDAKEAIARLVMTEMGEGYNTEAIKAQAVVVYTYLKYRDNNFEINGVTISDTVNDEVKNAVDAVYGEYLSYNGEVALTPYFAVAARKTADASSVFSQPYPYLKSVQVNGDPDVAAETYKVEKTFSLGEVKGLLLDFDSKLKLAENPKDWIKVEQHDASVSSSIGYVTKLTVGDKEVSGLDFKTKIMGSSTLLSHCFTVTYDATAETFTLTSYGDGLGVGMSQTGANHMAGRGSTYDKILSTYYKGAKLSKEANI